MGSEGGRGAPSRHGLPAEGPGRDDPGGRGTEAAAAFGTPDPRRAAGRTGRAVLPAVVPPAREEGD